MSESSQPATTATAPSFKIPFLPIKTVMLRADNIIPIKTYALGKDGLFLSEKGWKYRLKEMELGDYIIGQAIPLEKIFGLIPFKKVVMYYKSDCRMNFYPLLGEVLSQIPEDDVKKTVAFEILENALESTKAGKKLLDDERLSFGKGYIAYVVQLFAWDNATNMPPATT